MKHVYRFTILAVLLGCLTYSAQHGMYNGAGWFGFSLVCYLIYLGLVSENSE